MAHERWVKRMDDAVASSWLRGLRTAGRAEQDGKSPRLLSNTPRAKAPLSKLDRSLTAGADR